MPGGKSMDVASEMSSDRQPTKNFPALMGEGDKFYKDQLFQKAVTCFSDALELKPNDKVCLVARSSCYLKLGKNYLALQDAESALEEDETFAKGLYQKAEALYSMGEFELALVYYYRGKKYRPDIREFQLGINKSQEAIDNCVGAKKHPYLMNPAKTKLEVKGDLTYFYEQTEKTKQHKIKASTTQPSGYQRPKAAVVYQEKRKERRPLEGNQRTQKHLLGELYEDRIYLERLLRDEEINSPKTTSAQRINDLINDGLDYLDTRTEFWRQQRPIYARQKKHPKTKIGPDVNNLEPFVNRELEEIDGMQSRNKFSSAIQRTEKLINFISQQKIDEDQKTKYLAESNLMVGIAQLAIDKTEIALDIFKNVLVSAEKLDDRRLTNLANENLGKVYRKMGDYQNAINSWSARLPIEEESIERAWYFHSIGRCYLELNNLEKAEEYGTVTLETGQTLEDKKWRMNGHILVAQSQARRGLYTEALNSFGEAKKFAQLVGDKAAISDLTKYMDAINDRMEKGMSKEKDDLERQDWKYIGVGTRTNAVLRGTKKLHKNLPIRMATPKNQFLMPITQESKELTRKKEKLATELKTKLLEQNAAQVKVEKVNVDASPSVVQQDGELSTVQLFKDIDKFSADARKTKKSKDSKNKP
ncbi:hypothetical protein SNEBB_011084 [Seison nebaliae]|nr:hypothetical protein SNEBB_011084 [Seison nebaliae]